jgi:hypothetical protein
MNLVTNISDKELLDFGVVVAASDTFDPTARIAPSEKVPPREPGEPQAWISLMEHVLTNDLLQLKSMVRGNAHQRPSLPKVNTVIPIFNILIFLGGTCKYRKRYYYSSRM